MNAMTNARVILASLPIFAQSLAGAAKVKVIFDRNATTASTNGKTIRLPPLPVPTEDGDFAKVEELIDLVRGYIPHEIGHCHFTNFDELHTLSDVERAVWNCIEDPRQELELVKRFPGTRLQIDRLCERLASRGSFPVIGPSSNPGEMISFYVLYRLRGDIRDQEAFEELADQSRPVLVSTFGTGLITRLDVLLKTAGTTLRHTGDAIALSKAICSAIKEEEEKQQKANDPSDPDQADDSPDDEGDSSASQGDEGDGDPQSGEPESTQSDSAPSDAGDDEAPATGNGSSEPSPQEIASALKKFGEDVASHGMKDLGDIVAKAIDAVSDEIEDEGDTVSIADDPTAIRNVDPQGSPLSAFTSGVFDPGASMLQTGRLRSLMQNELQALQLQREHESVRGSQLNQRRLHRTSSGDRRVFLHLDERKQLNTAVFLLCDISGSMDGEPLLLASRAIYTTAVALGSLTGVTTAVGTFPTFRLVQRFGQRPQSNPNAFALASSGFTPLAEGVLWASKQLQMRQEEKKVLMVLTDGLPDCITSGKLQIAAAQLAGIDVMGLGIKVPLISQVFDKSSVIDNLEEIAPAMHTMIRGSIRSQLHVA